MLRENLIGYARVSTRDQNPDFQIKALQDAGCHRVFTDFASGTRQERPEFTACLDYLRKGDILIVWKLDRLGRNASHLIGLVENLAAREILFRSLTEALDTSTPTGKATFTILCAIAQMERDVLIERTRAGIELARAQGRRAGPKEILSRSALQQIRRLKSDPTISLKQIAAQYKVNRSTIYRALKRSAGYQTGGDYE